MLTTISKTQPVNTTIVATITLCCTLLLAFNAIAIEAVYKDANNIAINGYDPIAYHQQQRAVAGNPDYTWEWNHAIWYFTSTTNRDLFATNPLRWAPRYGGYCAFAVAHGSVAKTDPNAWNIVAGNLYLNYSPGVQTRWEQDIPQYIRRADAHWLKLLYGQ